MSIIKSNMTAPPPSGGGGLSSIGEMNSLRFDGQSYLSRAASEIANNDKNAPWTFSKSRDKQKYWNNGLILVDHNLGLMENHHIDTSSFLNLFYLPK